MKKIIVFLLIFTIALFLTSFNYAIEDNTREKEIASTKEQLPEVIELSLDDAIQYALQHNRDLKIQDLNIKKAQINYDDNIRIAKEYEKTKDLPKIKIPRTEPISPDSIINEKLLELGVTRRTLELNLNIANWNKQIKENEIKYNVEKAYYDLLLAKKQMDIAKESLELAKKQYNQSSKMYELGTISKQQLLSVELSVFQAQSGYDAAQMSYELQKMNFNNILGLPLDQEIILKDKIQYKAHEEIDLEQAIAEAMENNALLKVAKENYELAKLTLEATRARYPEITYKYREQEIAVEEAAKRVEVTENSIEMGIRSAYLALITAEKQIKTYEKAVEQAQAALELAELSFELGESTSTEVIQARIELMNAKENLAKQIHAYNMALLDFEYSIGLGKTQISAY